MGVIRHLDLPLGCPRVWQWSLFHPWRPALGSSPWNGLPQGSGCPCAWPPEHVHREYSESNLGTGLKKWRSLKICSTLGGQLNKVLLELNRLAGIKKFNPMWFYRLFQIKRVKITKRIIRQIIGAHISECDNKFNKRTCCQVLLFALVKIFLLNAISGWIFTITLENTGEVTDGCNNVS